MTRLGHYMDQKQKDAWKALKDVMKNFLRSKKDQTDQNIVRNMLKKYKQLRCRISLK